MNTLRKALGAIAIALTISAGLGASAAQAHQPAAARLIAGAASWYGPGFHGRLTANGERFDQNALTAAHKTLPFGTKLRVTNEHNGKSVVVRVNDRGPYAGKRVLDLSKGAAQTIGMIGSGVAPVKIEVIGGDV